VLDLGEKRAEEMLSRLCKTGLRADADVQQERPAAVPEDQTAPAIQSS
jgi:hypothetical protein